MTIKREYRLPNCILTLEGISEQADNTDSEPVMSTLVHAECQITSSNRVISGSRDFFSGLVRAVSNYAQECLSGLPHTGVHSQSHIHLEPVGDRHRHRLVIEPESDSNQEKVEIELTPVDFFDLLEAVDRVLADPHTLPELGVQPQPLSKRYRQMEESIPQQATPAAIGIVSLAVAAAAFYLIPAPEPVPERLIEPNPTEETIDSELEETPLTPTDGTTPEPESDATETTPIETETNTTDDD